MVWPIWACDLTQRQRHLLKRAVPLLPRDPSHFGYSKMKTLYRGAPVLLSDVLDQKLNIDADAIRANHTNIE
jgi:hypothetical protein